MCLIGMLGHFIFLFQAIKIIRCKCSSGVSLYGFLIAFFSMLCWLFYGYLKQDIALIMVNVFGAIASFLCILSILIYK
jgi:MtN3 and saliva related transmembrane protein